jgi:antitoxin (DNA-binding transcriptional repressor) of toxin-antitoxin stability system
MTTITLTQLHKRTRYWVMQAQLLGEIVVTDRGEAIAKIVPHK